MLSIGNFIQFILHIIWVCERREHFHYYVPTSFTWFRPAYWSDSSSSVWLPSCQSTLWYPISLPITHVNLSGAWLILLTATKPYATLRFNNTARNWVGLSRLAQLTETRVSRSRTCSAAEGLEERGFWSRSWARCTSNPVQSHTCCGVELS